MCDQNSRLSRRTFGTFLMTTLSGCSALDRFSPKQTIEVESRDLTWSESQISGTENAVQILYSEDEAELILAGNFVSSGVLTDLYPHVLTTTVSGHNKIQIRIEEAVKTPQSSDSVYRYLAIIRFQWVPSSIELLVQHQQIDGETTTVLNQRIPEVRTTTSSQ